MRRSTKKILNLSIIAFILFIHGCQFIEINIVQRAVIEKGQGLSTSSVDKTLKKESDQMELIVPLK